jgi:hypothetical protein
MVTLAETARWLAAELGRLDGLEIVTGGTDLPVVCVRLADDVPFSVFDLADRLRLRGWVVPAYRMAAEAQAVAVLRIVVREGLSADMAECFVEDVVAAIDHLGTSPPTAPVAADPCNPAAANPRSAAAASQVAGVARVPGTKHVTEVKEMVDSKTKAVC